MRSCACVRACLNVNFYACEISQWDLGSFEKCVQQMGFDGGTRDVKVVFRSTWVVILVLGVCEHWKESCFVQKKKPTHTCVTQFKLCCTTPYKRLPKRFWIDCCSVRNALCLKESRRKKKERDLKGRPACVCFVGMKSVFILTLILKCATAICCVDQVLHLRLSQPSVFSV